MSRNSSIPSAFMAKAHDPGKSLKGLTGSWAFVNVVINIQVT
jgi:hypothetical protein